MVNKDHFVAEVGCRCTRETETSKKNTTTKKNPNTYSAIRVAEEECAKIFRCFKCVLWPSSGLPQITSTAKMSGEVKKKRERGNCLWSVYQPWWWIEMEHPPLCPDPSAHTSPSLSLHPSLNAITWLRRCLSLFWCRPVFVSKLLRQNPAAPVHHAEGGGGMSLRQLTDKAGGGEKKNKMRWRMDGARDG